MDSKTFGIGILSFTALVLVVANCLVPPKATAEISITGQGYSVVTAKVQNGGDGVYILDNRTGKFAVFTWDNNTRRLEARQVRPLADAFVPRR